MARPGGTAVTAWAKSALSRQLAELERTEHAVGDRFPLSADPGTGKWTTTRNGSWTGGFWVGQLWLRARLTGAPGHRRAAGRWARRLADWAAADSVTRGLVLWYGVAAESRLGLGSAAEPLARAGAHALARTADPVAGVLPWGTAFGDSAEPVLARADGAPGTVPLLAWAGEKTVAAQHLRTHLELSGEPGGQSWAYSERAWARAADPPPGWTRGEAWTLLALADGAHWLEPALGDTGRIRAAKVPADFPALLDVPGSPPDSSAAVITAVALAKLGLHDAAADLVQQVLRTCVRDGRLVKGCHDLRRGRATAHQLVWGDFFLTLALAILAEAVDPAAV
ncbi:sugar ABC transporter permease [Amycolatopsis sp. AA4]|nr:sugar ABC transporter permease [Amycolatopsis sp. AA4]